MFGSFKVLKGLGIVGGVLAAGAAAGTALLLKRWANDPEASDLRVVVMNGKGIHLSKTDDGRVVVDTHYNVSEDEAIRGGEDEPTGPVLVVDMPEKVKAFTREAGADAKAAAELAADKAGRAAEHLKEKYGDKTEEILEKTEEKMGRIWEKTEDTMEQFREKAETAAGQLKEKAGEAASQLKERAGEYCDGLKNVAQLAKEQAEAFFHAADETTGEAKDCCECGAEEAAEKVEAAVEKAAECCQECAEKAGEKLEDLAEAAKDAAKEAADRIFPEE